MVTSPHTKIKTRLREMMLIGLQTGAAEEEAIERRDHRPEEEALQEAEVIVEASVELIAEVIEEPIVEVIEELIVEVIAELIVEVTVKVKLEAEEAISMNHVRLEVEEVDSKVVVEVIEEVDKPIKEPRDLLMRAHGNGNTKMRNAQFMSRLLYPLILRFLSFPKKS